jgi:hypothetical protein
VDESAVRAHAEAHGRAVAQGDLRTAAADLDGPARAQASEVMSALPPRIEDVEVADLQPSGEEMVVRTRYSGEGAEATIEARWAERAGRARIVELRVV